MMTPIRSMIRRTLRLMLRTIRNAVAVASRTATMLTRMIVVRAVDCADGALAFACRASWATEATNRSTAEEIRVNSAISRPSTSSFA